MIFYFFSKRKKIKNYRKFLIESNNKIESSPINHEILINKNKTFVVEYKIKRKIAFYFKYFFNTVVKLSISIGLDK